MALFNGYKKKARKKLIFALVFILVEWILVKLGKFLGFPSVSTHGEMYQREGIIVPLGISCWCESFILLSNINQSYSGWIWASTEIYAKRRPKAICDCNCDDDS